MISQVSLDFFLYLYCLMVIASNDENGRRMVLDVQCLQKLNSPTNTWHF